MPRAPQLSKIARGAQPTRLADGRHVGLGPGRIWTGLRLPGRRVIAPDLRGLGDSAPAHDGFDAETAVADLIGVLDALAVDTVEVAAIDASVPTAFLLGA